MAAALVLQPARRPRRFWVASAASGGFRHGRWTHAFRRRATVQIAVRDPCTAWFFGSYHERIASRDQFGMDGPGHVGWRPGRRPESGGDCGHLIGAAWQFTTRDNRPSRSATRDHVGDAHPHSELCKPFIGRASGGEFLEREGDRRSECVRALRQREGRSSPAATPRQNEYKNDRTHTDEASRRHWNPGQLAPMRDGLGSTWRGNGGLLSHKLRPQLLLES